MNFFVQSICDDKRQTKCVCVVDERSQTRGNKGRYRQKTSWRKNLNKCVYVESSLVCISITVTEIRTSRYKYITVCSNRKNSCSCCFWTSDVHILQTWSNINDPLDYQINVRCSMLLCLLQQVVNSGTVFEVINKLLTVLLLSQYLGNILTATEIKFE